MTWRPRLAALTALLGLFGHGPAGARTENAAERPPALTAVDYEQRLGNPLPLGARFRDERGTELPLGTYFGSRPVVLVPAYYACPMLCTLVLDGVTRALRAVGDGVVFEVVVFSIDATETPAQAGARKDALLRAGDMPAHWHLLTGEESAIRALTDAVGFHYAWDDANARWAHPAGIVVATPDGRVTRYLFGVDYAPRDVRLALVEASAGRLGSLVDRLLLFCYEYDPAAGAYGLVVLRTMRMAGVLTVTALAAFVAMALRRERRRLRHAAARGTG